MAKYEVIGVARGGTVIEHKLGKLGAPPENWLCAWGKAKGCAFVIRYFPSKKGWRVLDIRNATGRQAAGGRGFQMWQGQVRGTRYWPNKDAAIMYAIHTMSGHSSTA